MFGTTQRDPMLDLLYQLERRTGRIFNEPFRTFDWPAARRPSRPRVQASRMFGTVR